MSHKNEAPESNQGYEYLLMVKARLLTPASCKGGGADSRNTERLRKMNLIRKSLAHQVLFWERPLGGICCPIAVAALPRIREEQRSFQSRLPKSKDFFHAEVRLSIIFFFRRNIVGGR